MKEMLHKFQDRQQRWGNGKDVSRESEKFAQLLQMMMQKAAAAEQANGGSPSKARRPPHLQPFDSALDMDPNDAQLVEASNNHLAQLISPSKPQLSPMQLKEQAERRRKKKEYKLKQEVNKTKKSFGCGVGRNLSSRGW